jgi:hypothetical protein
MISVELNKEIHAALEGVENVLSKVSEADWDSVCKIQSDINQAKEMITELLPVTVLKRRSRYVVRDAQILLTGSESKEILDQNTNGVVVTIYLDGGDRLVKAQLAAMKVAAARRANVLAAALEAAEQ